MNTFFGSIRAVALLLLLSSPALAQVPDWKYSGSVWILTTPEGANLPASAELKSFPLLIRLHRDFFDFSQAKDQGADLRISTTENKTLPFQVEEWDAKNGRASIWVRVPVIRGNARQELKLQWGNLIPFAEASSLAVFDLTNGYVSAWHMGSKIEDVVGTLTMKDVNTQVVPGVIGKARHFSGKQGIFGGEKIPNYPSGGASHSTEAWVRAEQSNATIIGWGNEGGNRGSKVRMQLRSPPHLHIDSDFSDVDAPQKLPLGEWFHVAHTYEKGVGRIYINGQLAAEAKPTLNIRTPSRLWIGGWYHNYDFLGDLDEVRISNVARSPDWLKLQYENQKPLQTVVGPVVQPGKEWKTSATEVKVKEGQSITLTATAGGAQKLYWIVKRNGQETIAAVDQFAFPFAAGRVVGDEKATVILKAIYPNEVKTQSINVTIQEDIPEPQLTLETVANWDGRTLLEITPKITNLTEMTAKGADKLNYRWTVSGLATIHEVTPGKLTLLRAQNSGTMTVTLAVSNGGKETTTSVKVQVKEPASDPWISRTPARAEQPQDGQFIPRDDRDTGTVHFTGTLTEAADSVYLKVFADDKLIATERAKVSPDKSYAISAKLKAGLVHYKVEFGTKQGEQETAKHTAKNLTCGDVYLIDGQSNAEATDVGREDPTFTSEWIRSYGSMNGDPNSSRLHGWGNAVIRSRDGGKYQIGYWGMELGRRLVASQKIPVCILNGAVGGSRIDVHQRNAAQPTDPTTIYGRLLGRVRQAGLTHGVRAILWHQGENDQGADGPTGGYGHETYRDFFVEMAAGWKRDYPNVQHYYAFQIWPRACSMGINGSDNVLREVQRRLPEDFAHLSVMSTLGVKPPGGCHFPKEGYAEFARLITPLVERDIYGKEFPTSITAANLLQASVSKDTPDEITLTFDQPVVWKATLADQFLLDGKPVKIASAKTVGNTLVLKVPTQKPASQISYLDSRAWKETNLLEGANGIAALTFWGVPISVK